MTISFKELIFQLNQYNNLNLEYNIINYQDAQIFSGITDNPWLVKDNYIYLALNDEEFAVEFKHKTAADYIELAIQNHATLIVTNQELNIAVPQLISNNINRLSGFLCDIINGQPFNAMKKIGVTGTKGKTSTTQFLDAVLLHAGLKPAVIGTIGIFYDNKHINPNFLSNPHAVDLFNFGKLFKESNMNTLLMEITSHGAIFERNSALEFDAIILTNLTSDHLDFHHSVHNYIQAKWLYFERLMKQTKPAIAICNLDDPASAVLINHFRLIFPAHIKLVTYSMNNPTANYRARVLEANASYSKFELDWNNKYQGIFKINIPGIFNISNSLAVIAICEWLQIDLTVIKQGLEKKTNIPGRFEKINNPKNYHIIVDYAHTTDSLKNIIENLKYITTGRVITIFGCGGDRDSSKRPEMGNVATCLSDIVIITSDNSRFENTQTIIDQIVAGVSKANLHKVIIEPDRKQAIKLGLDQLKPEDYLLIAGKGHEKYQIINDQSLPFSDSAVVREYFQ